MNAFGPVSSPRHLWGNNRSRLVGGSYEIRAGIEQQIGQGYLNKKCRSQINGFTAVQMPVFYITLSFSLLYITFKYTSTLSLLLSHTHTHYVLKFASSTAMMIRTVIYLLCSTDTVGNVGVLATDSKILKLSN